MALYRASRLFTAWEASAPLRRVCEYRLINLNASRTKMEKCLPKGQIDMLLRPSASASNGLDLRFSVGATALRFAWSMGGDAGLFVLEAARNPGCMAGSAHDRHGPCAA